VEGSPLPPIDAAEPGAAIPADPSSAPRLSKQIASSATQLFIRRVVVQLLSAASTAVLARVLGVRLFGAYSAGLATYYLLLSLGDFGFSYTLARELGEDRADNGATVKAMIRVQSVWAVAVALVGLAVALVTGVGHLRMQVLLILLPVIAMSGLGAIRQVFYAAYETKRLGVIDVVSNAAQAVALAGVALLGASVDEIAIATTVLVAANGLAVYWQGHRLLDDGRATNRRAMELLRTSLPLGLSSFLASAYFSIDLALVAYLVSSRQVGYYSTATKALSLLVTVPGLVMTAALPGMAHEAKDRRALSHLLAHLWSWLAAIALPACLGVIVFAHTLVEIFFGAKYYPAVPLVRILAGSGVVALLSNVLGTAMVTKRRSRWLVTQCALALVINVAGNLLLVPRFGVTASAWLTVATEAFVCAGSAIGLVGSVFLGPLVRASVPVLAATAVLLVIGLPLQSVPELGIPAAGLGFIISLTLLGGWPPDLPRMIPIPSLVRSASPASDEAE
jgi:O-antigen/teichoic acid export membrane protein